MIEQDLILEGKVSLVTGGSRGIGLGIAKYLGMMKSTVVIADIDLKAAEEACFNLSKEKIDAIPMYVDIGDYDSIRKLVGAIYKKLDKIDILVNNAGVFDSRPIPEIKPDEWVKLLEININGMHYCSQIVIEKMIEQKSGKIVNLSSMSYQTGGLKAGVNYTTSKAAVVGLTRSYARYCAPYGITVNAVAPGLIKSEMTKSWADPSLVPMGYLGEPLDVARVVYFLCSPLSDYVTGQLISINGGMVFN